MYTNIENAEQMFYEAQLRADKEKQKLNFFIEAEFKDLVKEKNKLNIK